MLQRFWTPQVSSQFRICCVPFQVDTYKGCTHNCCYCFARMLVNHNRSNAQHEKKIFDFNTIEMNDPAKFKKWMKRVYGNKEINYKVPHSVFINNRVPLKIGALSDPCPGIELQEHITADFLKILGEYDYPIQILTKNPSILYESLKRIGNGLNLVVSVSMISVNDKWIKMIEPNAPSPSERLKAIEKIVHDFGYPVMIKMQPAIYPRIIDDIPFIILAAKNSGCWAVNTEGLKLRYSEYKNGREVLGLIDEKIRETYLVAELDDYDNPSFGSKKPALGLKEGGDCVLRNDLKLEYINLANNLAHTNGLKYFSADNDPMGVGDGRECCGTERLINYQLFDYNLRAKAFGVLKSSTMNNVDISYLLSGTQRREYYRRRGITTLKELIDLVLNKDEEKSKQLKLI